MEERLEQYIIGKDKNILDALKKINDNGKGITFVCDKENNFYGTLTDGDVRRHLVGGGELNVSVVCIMNTTPCVIYAPKDNTIDYQAVMRKKNITAMPVIDCDKKLIDAVCVYDDKVEIEKIDVPVVIMAGGKGTRLQPYTDILPKPLIPIGNKTITERIMDIFMKNGCSTFYMIVNYKKAYIKTYFSEENENYQINFVDENEYRGTGGGLALLNDVIHETFIMTNCDVLIEDTYAKYLKKHKGQENLVTIVGAKKNLQLAYGVMHVNEAGTVLGMDEKPQYSFLTNTGFYIIEPEFLKLIPEKNVIHMPELIRMCMEKGYKIGTYQISEDLWLDMGQMEELDKMRKKYEQ